MSLPVVRLTGSPYEQGCLHGASLRERIAHNVAVYFDRFARETLLDRPAVFPIARRWGYAVARRFPEYFAAMKGVADGSGRELLEIVALNARYEILYYQYGQMATAKAEAAQEGRIDGCTAYALLPETTASGHLLMGQNWDWIPEVQGSVLHTVDADGFETLAFTEAGIVGAKIGLNSAGLGLAINGMTTTDDDWVRPVTPFHVRCYQILRCRAFEDAVAIVDNEPRACSTNFLIAQAPDRIVDLEAGPDHCNALEPVEGILTHANHFVDPDSLGVVEPPNERRVYSRRRQARLRELLAAQTPVTTEGLQDALRDVRDEPFGVCRHRNPAEPPELHYITVTSVIADLDARTLLLTDGPPDQSEYQRVAL